MKEIKALIGKFLFVVVALPITLVGVIMVVIGSVIIAITMSLFVGIKYARRFLDDVHEYFMEGFSEKR